MRGLDNDVEDIAVDTGSCAEIGPVLVVDCVAAAQPKDQHQQGYVYTTFF